MRFKKITALFLVIMLAVLSLSACGAGAEPEPVESAAPAAVSENSAQEASGQTTVFPEETAEPEPEAPAAETEETPSVETEEAPAVETEETPEVVSAEDESSEEPGTASPEPDEPEEIPEVTTEAEPEEETVEKTLHFYVNNTELAVNWERNASVDALAELAAAAPVTIQMSMYGGFEQVGPIGTRLPSNDVQTSTSAGDIVLYSGSQIVVFYGSNSWAYTRLGKVAGKTASEMADLLSNGDVTVTISYE